MEPPSYEEAGLHPRALHATPPPSYDASLSSPPTPPPTYREAVTLQPDPFPVLTPPSVTSPAPNAVTITHQHTQVGVTPAINGRSVSQPAAAAAAAAQPPPVPITVTRLRDHPGLVRCPFCQHVVTTDVTYLPGKAAWCMCFLLTVMGLFCGFCLIPFMIRGLQDVHHSCPDCGNHLHTYER